jgi:serine beta-lactamase-like protein LACTB, mitochondrial
LAVLALLAASAPAHAYDARACAAPLHQAAVPPTQAQAAQAAIEAALAQDRGAGVQAAVYRRGQLIWSSVAGIAAAGPDQPVTRRTQMRVGSIAKLFTAIAAARLAAQGRLELDAPVQRLVPQFPDKGATITVRQLAAHTSGIRHYDFSKFAEANNTVRYATLSDALKVFANDPLVAPPGTRTHYSSFGFNLLGVAVERASGRTYGEAVASLVSRPFGLAGSVIDDPAAQLPCRSDFFTVLAGRRGPTPWRDSSDYYPSGGMLSTAEDLARMGDRAFAGPALSPAARKLLLSAGAGAPYSFGWQVGRNASGEIEWYGGGGATNGGQATVRHYPASGLTIAAASNYNVAPGAAAILRAAREELPRIFVG